METAKHFGSKLRKTLAALLATMALMAVLLPGALAVDLNVDVGFYFKQSRGGTCTLASAAMMLRRRAYLDGMDSWVDVTENGIKSTAWSGGLSHSFTYNDMHVGYATLPSGKAAKTEALVSILAEHPEGIVLYDPARPSVSFVKNDATHRWLMQSGRQTPWLLRRHRLGHRNGSGLSTGVWRRISASWKSPAEMAQRWASASRRSSVRSTPTCARSRAPKGR